MDILINPVLMGGTVKEVADGTVKVHLHGRLGVLTIPRRLIIEPGAVAAGQETKFFFSYLKIVPSGYDDDTAAMDPAQEIFPALLHGTLTEVNDTAVKVEMAGGYGTIAVPRRWVFTDVALAVGETAEFYFSCMHLVA